MTTQVTTDAPETTTSDSNDLGKLSFADYQAIRRGEKVESKESAPSEELEQKTPAKSDPAETDAEDSDESEDESGDEPDESKDSDEDKPKKKSGFKRKIDKLITQREAAKRELEYWKSEAMKNGATPTPKEEPKVEAKSSSEGEPQPDAFETHAEYVKAVTKWAIDQDRKAARAEEEKSKLLSEQDKLRKSYQERVKSFAEKTEDFNDVIENLADVRSPAVEQIILESENGPELLYELAKNPDEAKRICSLSPLAAAREMGKLESKIVVRASDDKKPEPKKLTSAPKPIEPVGSSKSSATRRSINDPDLPFSEYVELRRAQMKRRR